MALIGHDGLSRLQPARLFGQQFDIVVCGQRLDDIERAPSNPGRNPDALESRLLFRVIAAHPERVARVSRQRNG